VLAGQVLGPLGQLGQLATRWEGLLAEPNVPVAAQSVGKGGADPLDRLGDDDRIDDQS
jgi:hypothetical protein